MKINPTRLLFYQKLVLALVSAVIIGLFSYYSIWVSKKKESPQAISAVSLIHPDQRLPVNLKWLNGNQFEDIGKYQGQVVYVQVWAHHCVPCLEEIPVIVKWPLPKNIRLIFINVDDDEEQKILARNWLSSTGVSKGFDFFFDDQSFPFDNNRALPRHLVIDRNGKIAVDYSGIVLKVQDEWIKRLVEVVREPATL